MYQIRQTRRPACAIASAFALAVLAAAYCTGCWGQRQIPYQTISSGSIAGFSAPYRDVLEQLAGVRWAMVAASERDWASTRNLLNQGAGLELYAQVDFERFVVLAYFHGPAASRGHRVEVQSLTLRGDRAQVRFRFVMSGMTTDIGYPYEIIALDKADLWGRLPAAQPRQFDFTVWEGRHRVKTIKVTLDPPAGGAYGTWLPVAKILGQGLPQCWSPDGAKVLVCGEEQSVNQGMPAPGLFTVQAGIPGQADVPGQAGVPGQAAGSGQPNLVYLPDRGAADVARYSPDGSRLAFAVTEGGRLRLWVAALEDGRAVSPADLTPAGFDFNGGYAWSPDGSRLVLAGLVSTGGKQRYGLAVIPVAGQDPSGWLAFAQQWRLAAPSWSQGGGGRIFFLRETSQGTVLAGFDVAGGTPADILQVCGYDLSADGRWLAYLAETGPRERTLYVVELERLLQEGSRGTAVASGDISSPVISSDGGLVAHAAMGATPDESGPHVWLASAGGQWKSRLSTGAGARPVCFRPGAGGLLVELLPATTAGETPVTLAALFYLP